MAIPDYQTLMLPVLRCVEYGDEHRFGEVVETLAEQFDISADEQSQLLGSGQTVLFNRTGWARTYLKKAGLIEATGRGVFRITERGRSVLESDPERDPNWVPDAVP